MPFWVPPVLILLAIAVHALARIARAIERANALTEMHEQREREFNERVIAATAVNAKVGEFLDGATERAKADEARLEQAERAIEFEQTKQSIDALAPPGKRGAS